MAGQTHTKLKVGDRCIVHVDKANHPSGWWWGVVESIEWHDDHHMEWGEADVYLTGPVQFRDEYGVAPVYGDEHLAVDVNCTVYPADKDTQNLVRMHLQAVRSLEKQLWDAGIRLDELRELIRGMASADNLLGRGVLMRRVYKYKVEAPPPGTDVTSVEVIAGAEPLSVGVQGDEVYVWMLVDPNVQRTEDLRLRVAGTGHDIHGHLGRFLGTVLMYGGRLVWHVWLEQ